MFFRTRDPQWFKRRKERAKDRKRLALPPPIKRTEPWSEPDGPGGRLICNLNTKAGNDRYFALLVLMCKRQNWRCGLCFLLMVTPTFDHEDGRGMNGARRDDRIEVLDEKGNRRWQNGAVCHGCNHKKGSRRIPYLPHARWPRNENANG